MPKINFYNRGQSLVGIIIVLIIVSLLGGGLYVYLSKQIPKVPGTPPKSVEEDVMLTDGWKSFKSEKFNYEIKYPQTFEIDDPGDGFLVSWYFSIIDKSKQTSGTIILVVKGNSKKSSALSFARRNLGDCKTEKETSDFARTNCITEFGAQKTISSVYLKNDKAYIISLEIFGPNYYNKAEIPNFSSEIETYDLMLSTFKFLE